MFKIKTFTALIPTTLMMFVALSGCQDDSTKRSDARKKDDRPSPHLEDKADRLENKAERLENKSERMQEKADETRDTARPSVGEKMENEVDKIEDRIDDKYHEERDDNR